MGPLIFMLGLMLAIAGCGSGDAGPECKVSVDYGPIGSAVGINQRDPPAPPPPPPSPPRPPENPVLPAWIKVHGRVQGTKLVEHAMPEYPASACAAGVAGRVHVSVTVATDGSIREAEAVEGHPDLSHAATLAIKKWRYRPTSLNGKPVEVRTNVYVQYRISPRHPGE